MLKEEKYVPTKPVTKVIQDKTSGKIRKINKPNFYPDQIVHWALMLQLQPVLMKGMYEYNCGSVPGRGTSHGQKALRRWLNKDYRGTKWCLKMDIEKYYPSINNEILKRQFRRKVKDEKCLRLIDSIIDQTQGQPIGFFTAQWFSNFFLEGLDHFIKQELKVKYYIRYVDDLVLIGPNKRKLHRARKEIEQYLNKIDLKIKGNWQVFKIDDRGIDFLGLRFFRNRTILRKKNALRIKRRMAKIRRKGYLNEKDAQALISYWGWIKRSDSYNFYHKNIKQIATIKQAKKVVSTNAKLRNVQAGREFVIKLKANRRVQTYHL